ncbi:uncharacterized protein UTRI_04493 [Ustilago trichophora]|uniref:BRCT domain-containing protein n=1 Tax=Ustilago trichophora TaxID=86804 RepID=A0A5C3EEZ4_9BASI|nr:uncharacterized protein UTRI_04493 [Ustilago trichophora]
MSATSPQKRRATTFRTSMLEQPMRQTRSMARISDAMDFAPLSSTSRLSEQCQSASSSPPQSSSPRKARASQAAQIESFDVGSPDVSMAPCMQSPKKGRFDDFEFELENSIPDVPTRRRRIAAPRQASTSPSADVGLPRSKTSTTLKSSTTSNTLLASRKENSPSARTEQTRAGASPVKPLATLPRASRLHGPTPTARTSSQAAAVPSQTSASADQKMPVPFATTTAPTKPSQQSTADIKTVGSSRDSSHRLLFGTSDIATGASVKRNPFHVDIAESNSLAALGEPRHSPVKRFQPKSEFIISSPDRPDRKPINLLELKPSPGKAQRGIFRHNTARDDEEDDDDGWDDSGSNTVDEIRLVKGPAPKKGVATVAKTDQTPSSSDSNSSSSSSSSTKRPSESRTPSTLDVKHTLSSETSDALANLEASLAKLKAKTSSPPSVASSKKKGDSGDSTMKRELGTARLSSLPSSRTQIFRAKTSISGGDSSFSARSTADQSGDSSVFKRPSGRVSALAKSRESSSDLRSALNPSLASSKSMMSFGAPRLPGYSELSGRPSKPLVAGSRTSSLDMSLDHSRSEEQAAQEEEEARVVEAKRQAELKAAKRKSMSSILSSGMPPPLQRKEAELARPASGSTSKSASRPSGSTTTTAELSAAESTETKKAAKAARRRSLYTASEGDRSIGNLSTSLGISGNASASEGDTSTVKKARFLRGLTVLVDVRDQDGEDASACWVEMLKNAGAKVLVRFGERKLTHIVYKSGRPSTLHTYRALEDPKPHVVGISWVVACLDQGKKADETPYLVEVGKQAIFATKRRTSMGPKQAPSSATSIRELPKEMLKDVEVARKKLLAHAPAVPSPLRRRVSSRSLLVSRLAATSLHDQDDTSAEGDENPFSAAKSTYKNDPEKAHNEGDNDGDGEEALLESYRARVKSVLSSQRATVLV